MMRRVGRVAIIVLLIFLAVTQKGISEDDNNETIKILILRSPLAHPGSWAPISFWCELNESWKKYGSTPIHIIWSNESNVSMKFINKISPHIIVISQETDMNKDELDVIREYVKSGGGIIQTYEPKLKDIAGVDYKKMASYQNKNEKIKIIERSHPISEDMPDEFKFGYTYCIWYWNLSPVENDNETIKIIALSAGASQDEPYFVYVVGYILHEGGPVGNGTSLYVTTSMHGGYATYEEYKIMYNALLYLKSKNVRKSNPPIIKIKNPSDGDVVSGIIEVTGILKDADSCAPVKKVMYRLDGGTWFRANSTDGKWNFTIDTTLLENREYTLTVRVVDVYGSYTTESIRIKVKNNHPPVARFTMSKEETIVGDEIIFDASESYDPEGSDLTYKWDFGDDEIGYGKIITHKYQNAGVYYVVLEVCDGEKKDIVRSQIQVNGKKISGFSIIEIIILLALIISCKKCKNIFTPSDINIV